MMSLSALIWGVLHSPFLYICIVIMTFPNKVYSGFKSLQMLFFTHLYILVSNNGKGGSQRDLDSLKTDLFKELQTMESGILELQAKGLIRVLEVGCGPGSNFKYYTKKCLVMLADPNPYFESYVNAKKSKFPNLNLEKFIICEGEHLKDVADNSIDAVVTTYVLCSCRDRKILLREVRRVLRPGGKYIFLEHVLGDKGSWSRFIQYLFGACWYMIFLGCSVTRDHQEVLESSGFSNLKLKRQVAPTSFYARPFVGPNISGCAIK